MSCDSSLSLHFSLIGVKMSKEQLIALWCTFLHEGLISGEVMNVREQLVLEASGEGALELFGRLYGVAEIVYQQVENDLEVLRQRPPIFEYDVISLLGTRLQAQLLDTHDVNFVLTNSVWVDDLEEIDELQGSRVSIALASLMLKRKVIKENGYYDEETRHSGDLEYLDRYYFKKFGEYKYDNFWYWLNYTLKEERFYYHVYDVLYIVKKGDGSSITDNHKIEVRKKYLNKRRELFRGF